MVNIDVVHHLYICTYIYYLLLVNVDLNSRTLF